MAAIKGVGEGAAKVIIDERTANGRYTDFADHYPQLRQSGQPPRDRSADQTGAFDSLGHDRGHLLHDLDAELAEADSRRKTARRATSLFDDSRRRCRHRRGRPTRPQQARRQAMPMAEKLQHEELLGFYISGTRWMRMPASISPSATKARTSRPTPTWQAYRLGGIISNLQIKYTRKDSRQMAVFNLATRARNYELIMFPEPFEKNGARLENGKLALIHGTTNRREVK